MSKGIPLALLRLDVNAVSKQILDETGAWAINHNVIVMSDRRVNTVSGSPVLGSPVLGSPAPDFPVLSSFEHWLAIDPLAVDSNTDACLCCGLNSGLGDHLRQIFFAALSNKTVKVQGVLVISPDAHPAHIQYTLKHTPFLGQRYRYVGMVAIDESPASRRLNHFGAEDVSVEATGVGTTEQPRSLCTLANLRARFEDLFLNTVH